MEKQEIEILIKELIETYKKESFVDEKKKEKILKHSTAWNKDVIMNDLITKLEEIKLYNEDGFAYGSFINKFFEVIPNTANVPTEKHKVIKLSVEEQDFS